MPSFTKLPRHFIVAGTALLILVVCTVFYLYDGVPVPFVPTTTDLANDVPGGLAGPIIDSEGRPIPTDCPAHFQYLARAKAELQLSDRVHYTRRCIKPVFPADLDRNRVVNITEPLIPEQDTEVDIFDCWNIELPDPECIPIELAVPAPHPAEEFSHIIFGVATDYDRLEASRKTFVHWLGHSKAKLVAALTDWHSHSWEQIEILQNQFAEVAIELQVVEPLDRDFTVSQNHFAVLGDMVQIANGTAEWYVLIDDDTFYPHLKPLSDSLRTLNHNKDFYVGALSEDFGAVRQFGYMAFGGAGAYMSSALGTRLGEQREKCIAEATQPEGDIIIRDCVYRNSKAKLTQLPGLYQQDMRDDVSGFFEAGLSPITLHHWKSWYHEPVVKMSRAAVYCADCFLQRWRFGEDTVFTNGYSIVKYTDGHQDVDLHFMEGTWSEASRDYDFSVGPLRQPLPPALKKSWRLMDAEFERPEVLKQLYVQKGNRDKHEIDQVIELVWDMDR